MASVSTAPITPVPVFATEARMNRADDAALPLDKVVDMSSDAKKLPEELNKSETMPAKAKPSLNPPENPMDLARPDVRPVIERLDGTKDIAETLKTEESDPAERQMQASEAYQTLRQSDDNPTSVGKA